MKALFCGYVLIVEQGGRLVNGEGLSGIIRWGRCIRVKVRVYSKGEVEDLEIDDIPIGDLHGLAKRIREWKKKKSN